MSFDFFNTQAHSLQEFRLSINEDLHDPREFITILKEHHDYLQESIRILIDPKAETSDKQEHLSRFFALLNVHGHAEEETLYAELKANRDKLARVEGIGGEDEHEMAFQMEKRLRGLNYQSSWTDEIDAHAKIIATLVLNHIKEEESQMFRIAKKDISFEDMDRIGREYLLKCQIYLNKEIGLPPRLDDIPVSGPSFY